MRRYLAIIAVLSMISCVGDYNEANPPRQLDSPDVKISVTHTELTPGDFSSLTINITDAPGKIDSLGYEYDPSLGILTIDESSFEAIKGQEKGTFKATWTSATTEVGEADITFSVYDAQKPRRGGTISVTIETIYAYDAPVFAILPGGAAMEDSLILGGSKINFTLNISKVPGGFGSIVVDGGTGVVSIDNTMLTQLKGKTSGTLNVEYTSANKIGTSPVSFTIFDNTDIKRPSTTIIRSINVDSCAMSEILSGTYMASAKGKLGKTDSSYSINTLVTLTQPYAGVGIVEITDLSFGVYNKYYDRVTKPNGTINICDGIITERKAVDKFDDSFTITGKLNPNGTLTLKWSNKNGDSGDVTLTKQ